MKIFKRDAYDEMLEWKKRRESKNGHGAHALEIRGPRQCGKTTLINQFARDNYKRVVSIHLGDEKHVEIKNEWKALDVSENFPPSKHRHEYIYNLLRRFDEGFVDSCDTVILIDEIQECHHVHRLIRTMAWEFESHLIVSGSYLTFILENKDFFLPAGATHTINLTPLTFAEFLGIFEAKRELYDSIDLYGGSEDRHYDELKGLYDVYCRIGGYPSVVQVYLDGLGAAAVDLELERIIKVFSDEVVRYMDSKIDKAIFPALLGGIAEIMMREKKGQPDLINELLKLSKKDERLKVSREMLVHAVAWLEGCGIVGYAVKMNECKFNDRAGFARFYYMDLGIANIFLREWTMEGMMEGLLSENFAYLQLRPMILAQNLVPKSPAFGTYKDGEIDFILFNMNGGTSYGLEVKHGKTSSNTAERLLSDGVVDHVVYAKGDTKGGKAERIITIPLYLLGRFSFEDFTGKAARVLEIPEVFSVGSS